jgi:5-formyltetrahydrofolate cyclo-ligase
LTKSELRKIYLQRRQQLSEAEYLHLNRLLCEHFFASIDLSFLKVVHTYLPIREKKECDTWLMVERIRREFPHIRISLPKLKADGEMINLYFEGMHQLEKSTWGIEEPRQGVPTPAEKIDLVLVPLLCFDEHGNRVGYGKGYYDTFLASCKPSCQKIGISFFSSSEAIDDVHKQDIPLDSVLTPTGFLTFK